MAVRRRGGAESVRPFRRDAATWMIYLVLAFFAYAESALGPAMPLLRAELGFGLALASWHFAAFAGGGVVAGLVAARVAPRFGRRRLFWFGAGGMAIGVVLVAASPHPTGTLAGAAAMGAWGTLLLITSQAALADRHGAARAVALTESNVVASLASILAAVAVGALARTALGWRGALVAVVLYLAVVALLFARTRLPERVAWGASPARGSTPAGRGRLSVGFWALWGVLVCGVAVEWSVVFWGADALAGRAGLAPADAAAAMAVFFAAMTLGRFVGSRLARWRPADRLLPPAVGLALVGFPVFWLATTPPLAVVGLALTGLGMANVYPFALAAATAAAQPETDLATGRLATGAAAAILLAPLLLGTVAARAGIAAAFAIVPPLLAVALGLAVAGWRRPARPIDVVGG